MYDFILSYGFWVIGVKKATFGWLELERIVKKHDGFLTTNSLIPSVIDYCFRLKFSSLELYSYDSITSAETRKIFSGTSIIT